MRRWFLVLVVMLLLASLALATAAYAKEIEGTGTLWAKGAGVAVLRGDGEVKIEGCGNNDRGRDPYRARQRA